jgi:hypothetical protein
VLLDQDVINRQRRRSLVGAVDDDDRLEALDGLLSECSHRSGQDRPPIPCWYDDGKVVRPNVTGGSGHVDC